MAGLEADRGKQLSGGGDRAEDRYEYVSEWEKMHLFMKEDKCPQCGKRFIGGGSEITSVKQFKEWGR